MSQTRHQNELHNIRKNTLTKPMLNLKFAFMFLAAFSLINLAYAQDQVTIEPNGKGSFSIELNALKTTDAGCLMIYLIENSLGNDINKSEMEIVVFDKDFVVDRLTVLDLGAFPNEKKKVRQFNLPDTSCENISQILINDIPACEGETIEAHQCMDQLKTSTRTQVEFGG